MLSLFIRNFIFTILQPGIVAGLVPFWILGNKLREPLVQPLQFYHYSGIILFVTGFAIMLSYIIRFAVQGRGTLSPADPTKKLVITGLYKFSRNLMYVGVTLILIGEAVFFSIYSAMDLFTLCFYSLQHFYDLL